MSEETTWKNTTEMEAKTAPGTEKPFHIPTQPFSGTPDQIETQWYEQVYVGRGDRMPQLTLRAILMGSVLGGILSLTNIYMGLKTGWAFGVAITACILSYSTWQVFLKLRLSRTPLTVLENNCMQSTASSAGYSTGGTLISAFAAYMMLNPDKPLDTGLTMLWVFFLAVLGVTMAIPMKRQMVNVEQLRFPSGIAAAETLEALCDHSGKGLRAAKALAIAGVFGAIDKIWAEGFELYDKASLKLLDKTTHLAQFSSNSLLGKLNEYVLGEQFAAWSARTTVLSWDLALAAAGILTGPRVCFSMLASATLCWGVFVPYFQCTGVIPSEGAYKELVQWTLWGGTSCMVVSGLLSFALQWRSVLRAFGSIGRVLLPGGRKSSANPVDAIETPMSWFLAGQVVGAIALSILGWHMLAMPVWQSLLAVVLSFFIALVACRITGETDCTPIGPLGKVTQLTFGIIAPKNVNVNLMSANITSAAAASAADLLTDLKSGYLLGANPRKQFIAQFCGIFIGTVVTVLAFKAMVPNAAVLGGAKFPAPSALTWKAVAEALGNGLDSIESLKIQSIVVGAIVGAFLTLLPYCVPERKRATLLRFLPSASGVGLAWCLNWYSSLMFAMGAVVAMAWQKASPKSSDEFAIPTASGLIAGSAIMGVVVIFAGLPFN